MWNSARCAQASHLLGYVHVYVYLHTHNTGNVQVGGSRGAGGGPEMIIRYLFSQVSTGVSAGERSDVPLSETRGFIYVCVYIYVLPSRIFSAIRPPTLGGEYEGLGGVV